MNKLAELLSYPQPRPSRDTAIFLETLNLPSSGRTRSLAEIQTLWNALKRSVFRVKWLDPYRPLLLNRDGQQLLEALEDEYGLSSEMSPSASIAGSEWSLLPAPADQRPTRRKLSIVAVSRNDNHGGQLELRMQAFLDTLARQSEALSLPIEIILVEWNPPADRPRFRELLRFPPDRSHATVRIIEVPETRHRHFAYAHSQALYQMIGKNVGIRRAEGQFVLCTNVDILLSDELFSFLANAELDAEAIYRCDRHDAKQLSRYDRAESRSLLEYCVKNPSRYNRLRGTYNLDGEKVSVTYADTCPTDALPFPELHTNGCGDFQLMSRDQWFRLGGYAEFDCFSLHIDSVLQITAHFAGIREVQLQPPLVCYHLDHANGWTPEVERDGSLDANLKSRRLPRLDYGSVVQLAQFMKERGGAFSLNQASWGLGGEALPEETLSRGIQPCPPPTPSDRLSDGLPFLPRRYPLVIVGEGIGASERSARFIDRHLDLVGGVIQRLAKQRPVRIWGAGQRGRLLLHELRGRGIAIEALVDSNVKLQGTSFEGLPVQAPETLAARADRAFVVVASMFSDSIAPCLEAFGFAHGQDYFDPFF